MPKQRKPNQMASMIAYRFADFPWHYPDGHERLVSGSVVVAVSQHPGDSFTRWRATRIVLDSFGPLCPGCRAKVENWLHGSDRHNRGIQFGLALELKDGK